MLADLQHVNLLPNADTSLGLRVKGTSMLSDYSRTELGATGLRRFMHAILASLWPWLRTKFLM